jgi:hypothetical protein|tara:strand:+ start:353 stop:526 length:174 start_codon:yes stop_codon:yes gene_type:complete
MINYETRQDGDVAFAAFTREGVYFEVPTATGQTEEEIQAALQRAIDLHILISSNRGG